MSDTPRSDQLASVFEEAVGLATPAEQVALLERLCADDPDLRREVEALLRAHQRAGEFLLSDSRLDERRAPADSGIRRLKLGEQVGPYRLLRVIGEGAVSIVYAAEQEHPVRRLVALKIIKAGMDTRQVMARFELERQALALMDHPGIAKVLDAGTTPNDRPFFVMELVRGLPITRHCDAQGLGVDPRLELFMQVCKAVLHAHQKGILHRDIKPENILVCLHDDRAFPKVIDFGIAKVLRGHNLPGTSVTWGTPLLGTPAYMSPEQAQLTMPDLDTRTDTYSLGALLYELLVGHPPFDHRALMAAGLDEMCRIIRSREPPRPSLRLAALSAAEQASIASARGTTPAELRRKIAGDLDWITLKALEKNRDQRYDTPASLVDDIRRHLDHLPVAAAAPTVRYRVSKLLRRNRKTVVTTTAFAVLLLAGAVVTGVMGLRARDSARQALSLQAVAQTAERQSHAALIDMQVLSGLAAANDGDCGRAVLWFANAAHAAGTNHPDYQLHLRRARAWLERTPVPVGAFRLPGAMKELEFSAGSKWLLAVDRAGGLKLWDCVTQQPLDWADRLGPAAVAAWHPNGTRVALVLKDSQIHVRSVPDGIELQTIRTGEAVRALAFNASGQYLLFGGKSVRAFDLVAGEMLGRVWPHPASVIGFGSSTEPDRMVSVCLDGKARVLFLIAGPDDPVDSPAFAHRPSIRIDSCTSKTAYRQDFLEAPELSRPALADGGKRLVTRTGPYEISTWEVASGALRHRSEGMCCSSRFMVSSDGRLLAGAFQGGKVGVWEVATGRQCAHLTSSGACILDLAFGPAAETLITAEANGLARLWSIPDARSIHSAIAHLADVDKVAFAPTRDLVATAQSDGLVRLWILPDESKGYRIACDPGPKVVRMDAAQRYFAASREAAWEAEIRTATIYSADSGKPAGPTFELAGNLEDVAISPDGGQAAVGFGLGDNREMGALEFRDVRSGRVTGQATFLGPAASISWDPLGGWVAAICHSGHLLVIDTGSSTPTTWFEPLPSAAMRVHPFVAFTPDGGSLISLSPAGVLEVRNARTGRLRYPGLRADPVGFWHFAVSPDGCLLAGTTRDGRVDVWAIETGKRQAGPLPHPGWVYRCHFSPDSRFVVTASHDRRSRIWEIASGQIVGHPLVHPHEVYDATFTPDGRWVLTACRDGTVRMWHRQSGQLVAPPCAVGSQAFTVEVTADGRFAVVGSLDDSIHVLSLATLYQEVDWDSAEMRLLAEIVSGSVVTQGKIRGLTTEEWLRKEQELQGLHDRRVILKRASATFPTGVFPADAPAASRLNPGQPSSSPAAEPDH